MSAAALVSGMVSSLLSMVAWEGVHVARRHVVRAVSGNGRHRR